MPTPVAKGLIITLSALVAAGIAVYESPQFRQWVDTSRRKIALALHNLGDEIQPRDSSTPLQEDISMTEDVGEEAAERRRVAREEIQRRSALFEARLRKREHRPGSFDDIVDEQGNLRGLDTFGVSPDTQATSTGVDLSSSYSVQPESQQSSSLPTERDATDANGKLHIDLPSREQPQSLIDVTPTSEVPDQHISELEQSGFFSVASGSQSPSSSHTEGQSQVYYQAHPNPNNETQGHTSPFADPSDLGSDRPSTPTSTTGSYSHVYESAADADASDGTLSDLGQSVGGVATPASWSEVGSVISDDEVNHHGL